LITTDDYFRIFNIKRISEIDKKELTKRYRKLVFIYHPDKPSGDKIKFLIIHDAYVYLNDRLNEFLKKENEKFYNNPDFYFYSDGSIYDIKNKKWIRLKDEKGNIIDIHI
jgi:curved DNA-binding protein CbpA